MTVQPSLGFIFQISCEFSKSSSAGYFLLKTIFQLIFPLEFYQKQQREIYAPSETLSLDISSAKYSSWSLKNSTWHKNYIYNSTKICQFMIRITSPSVSNNMFLNSIRDCTWNIFDIHISVTFCSWYMCSIRQQKLSLQLFSLLFQRPYLNCL